MGRNRIYYLLSSTLSKRGHAFEVHAYSTEHQKDGFTFLDISRALDHFFEPVVNLTNSIYDDGSEKLDRYTMQSPP